MKKILLVLICFLLTGCYDYQELNTMDFVIGMAISKEEDYTLTLEVAKPSKDNEDTSYFVSGNGSTIEDALKNVSRSLRNPFYDHLKVVLLSYEIHPYELSDYFLRSESIQTHFKLLYTENPNKVLKQDEENRLHSTYLYQLVTNEDTFEIQMGHLLKGNETIIIPIIDSNLQILDSYYLVNETNKRMSTLEENFLLNLMQSKEVLLSKDYITISLTGNLKLDYFHKQILFQIEGTLEESHLAKDYLNEEEFSSLKKYFEADITSQLLSGFSSLQKDSFDVFGWNTLRFEMESVKKNYLLTDDLNLVLDFYMNQNGLIGADTNAV